MTFLIVMLGICALASVAVTVATEMGVLYYVEPGYALMVPVRVRRGEIDVEVAATGLVDVVVTDDEGVQELRNGDEVSYYKAWRNRRRVRALVDGLPRRKISLLIYNHGDEVVTVGLRSEGEGEAG